MKPKPKYFKGYIHMGENLLTKRAIYVKRENNRWYCWSNCHGTRWALSGETGGGWHRWEGTYNDLSLWKFKEISKDEFVLEQI